MPKHNPLNPFSAVIAATLMCSSLSCLATTKIPQSACPTEDFKAFFTQFATTPTLQQAFTATPLTLQTVIDGQPPSISLSKLDAAQRPAELIPSPKSRQAAGLISEWLPPSTVVLRGSQGEYLRAFVFKRQSCWVLSRIEDWTLGGSQLLTDASTKPDAKRCLKRAKTYEFLGNSEQTPSTQQLFIAALDSYLCAADAGSPEASYAAASLSLSGQAPRLQNDRIESLFIVAANRLPEAALSLSDFYCNEGDYTSERPCAAPEKAGQALLKAARMGSPKALNQLGYAYEAGTLVNQDKSHALACYRAAADKGLERASKNLQRLNAQGVLAGKQIECIQAGR